MYLLGNLNIWESFHFEDRRFRFTVPSITINLAMSVYGGSIFCWVSVVETEGSKSDLVAHVWLDSDLIGPLSVSDKLSAGLFSLVCANCSGSFSEDSLIFLKILSKVLTLRFRLRARHFYTTSQ